MKYLIVLLTAACLLTGCGENNKRRQLLVETYKTTEIHLLPDDDTFLVRDRLGAV